MTTQKNSPSFGALDGLIGTWVGVKGWSLIAVPSPGTIPNGNADFMLIVQNYRETLTFTPIHSPVLNRGGVLNQMIGAIQYEQHIHDIDTSELIHVENGMLMYLGDIEAESGSQVPSKPKFSIARSATIPHGDSAMILGDATIKEGSPIIPDIASHPSALHLIGAPTNFLEPYRIQQERLTIKDIVTGENSMLFNVINPNDNLQRDNNGLDILKTTHIALDSQKAGGITNIPFIVKHANATRFKCDFWLETIKLPMSNQNFEQLQYSQIVDIEFHKKFNGEAGLISWPHVTINTLTKQ
ncbi:MAG: hypothetical protein KAG14_02615 [Mycoplasmataceae bacterium]|nr:hypothetical protein [Mycoplasmataceae bacterium]